MSGTGEVLSRLVVLAVFALGGIALSACTSPTSALAPSASPCFEAIPIASETLHDHGRLLGVRSLTPATINQDLRKAGNIPIPTPGLNLAVHLCVVGYHGPFTRSEVPSPWPLGRRTGADALVIFSPDRRHVLYTVLVSKVPLRLSRI